CERVALAIQASLKAGHTPIVLSGDHSSALGTISGIKAAFPDKQLGVIWIDAHSDIHSPYTSPSGNIHGMPLAAALAEDNLSCQINYPEKSTIDLWERLKNIGCPGAKIVPDHLIYYGLRDFESAEDELITQKNIRVFTVAETREKTIADCVNTTKELLKNCDLVYISFDVDSMDCNAVSHGTGTPVPNGFFPEEIKELLSQLIHALPITCLEVAEINPLLDTKGNFMAETAFQLLESATRQMEG
ncbi:MAG: arginase, partial [Bacteroidota bacterium]